ncbi:MAG: protein kinase, partial [Longimicrobiales bacterium]
MTETLLGGRYRLDEPIGRGGMAAVWRATDTVLSRPVAVKRLHAGLVADEEHRERFRREALMVARLSHPNLVHVLDRGEDGGGPYLVLELVDGEDLKSLLRREGPLAPERAARVCSQVAQALAYAHGQGLVHRDIKAQNVLLSEDGAAKLADFGIARMVGGEHEAGLTRTDMLLGSADYLSPEQANGKTLDALSDVYSLGIVLFECLTATLPYVGEGFVAVAMKHCSEPPPDPRTVLADVPEWMAEVVLRATQKDPADRYPSAAAMATALESGGPRGGG